MSDVVQTQEVEDCQVPTGAVQVVVGQVAADVTIDLNRGVIMSIS